MTKHEIIDGLEVGYDIPACHRHGEDDIQTPCLILDLDALERNIKKMGDYAKAHNMRHRAHGKMHKSVDVLQLQQSSAAPSASAARRSREAEVFARAGIKDILVSNEVRDPPRSTGSPGCRSYGARIIVCVDDVAERRRPLRRRPEARHHARMSSSRSTAAPAAAASRPPRPWSRSPRRSPRRRA